MTENIGWNTEMNVFIEANSEGKWLFNDLCKFLDQQIGNRCFDYLCYLPCKDLENGSYTTHGAAHNAFYILIHNMLGKEPHHFLLYDEDKQHLH